MALPSNAKRRAALGVLQNISGAGRLLGRPWGSSDLTTLDQSFVEMLNVY